MRKVAALSLAFISYFSIGATQAETIWKLQPFPQNCKELAQDQGSEGQDYVAYKCSSKIFPTLWQTFHEGVRQSIGFGPKQNAALENAAAQRSDWPIEWGGEMRKGKFVAQVGIARFNFDEGVDKPNLKQFLVVFKILPNGTSCVVANIGAGNQQNQKAKAIAAKARSQKSC